jgi:hypothetical protein
MVPLFTMEPSLSKTLPPSLMEVCPLFVTVAAHAGINTIRLMTGVRTREMTTFTCRFMWSFSF